MYNNLIFLKGYKIFVIWSGGLVRFRRYNCNSSYREVFAGKRGHLFKNRTFSEGR